MPSSILGRSPRACLTHSAWLALALCSCSPDDFSDVERDPQTTDIDGSSASASDASRESATTDPRSDAATQTPNLTDGGSVVPEAGPPVLPDAGPSHTPDAGPSTPPDAGVTCLAAEKLVGYWPFDDTPGDLVQASKGGSVTVVPDNVAFTDGQRGGALGAGRIVVTAGPLLQGADALTISAFVRVDQLPQERNVALVWNGDDVGNDFSAGYTLALAGRSFRNENFTVTTGNPQAGQLGLLLTDGTRGQSLFVSKYLAQDRFVHVAASFDGLRARLYVDGALAVDVAQQVTVRRSSYPVQIGSALPGVLDPLRGALDEVALFNRALSADEVAALSARRGLVCIP